MSTPRQHSVDQRFQLQCPRDRAPMEKFIYQGFQVDRCLACGCMWFDHEELERVVGCERSSSVIDGEKRMPHRRRELLAGMVVCPRDGTQLVVREHEEQSHVEIDQCPSCRGMLLDPGELRDLANVTLAERVTQAWRQFVDWSKD